MNVRSRAPNHRPECVPVAKTRGVSSATKICAAHLQCPLQPALSRNSDIADGGNGSDPASSASMESARLARFQATGRALLAKTTIIWPCAHLASITSALRAF
jgi:hypothetical protein